MRLARHGSPGAERPVAAGSDGVWHDLTPLTADITPEFLATGLRGLPATLQTLPRVERLERTLIREALDGSGGNQTRAAEALGLSRFGLQKKLREQLESE